MVILSIWPPLFGYCGNECQTSSFIISQKKNKETNFSCFFGLVQKASLQFHSIDSHNSVFFLGNLFEFPAGCDALILTQMLVSAESYSSTSWWAKAEFHCDEVNWILAGIWRAVTSSEGLQKPSPASLWVYSLLNVEVQRRKYYSKNGKHHRCFFKTGNPSEDGTKHMKCNKHVSELQWAKMVHDSPNY